MPNPGNPNMQADMSSKLRPKASSLRSDQAQEKLDKVERIPGGKIADKLVNLKQKIAAKLRR